MMPEVAGNTGGAQRQPPANAVQGESPRCSHASDDSGGTASPRGGWNGFFPAPIRCPLRKPKRIARRARPSGPGMIRFVRYGRRGPRRGRPVAVEQRPTLPNGGSTWDIGSGGRDRTYDQLINSQLLYR